MYVLSNHLSSVLIRTFFVFITLFTFTSQAKQATTIFNCTSPSLRTLYVYSDGHYDITMRDIPWFTNGTITIRSSGQWYSLDDSSLHIAGGVRTAGTDEYGSFTKYTFKYITVGGASPNLPILASFICYSSGLLSFATTWPSGASNTNTSYLPDTGFGIPISQFPSFPLGSGSFAAESIGWLVNGGIWTIFEVFGVGLLHGFRTGDSPIWLYNTSYAPATGFTDTKPDTLIMSALDNFKSTYGQVIGNPVLSNAPSNLVYGTYGTVTSVPAGYTLTIGLWGSNDGINTATYEWGNMLMSAYNTTRIPTSRDISNSKLSYFSDNGANLFQSFWDNTCPTRNCTAYSVPNGTNAENVFLGLQKYHQENNIPVGLYQFDTWYFIQGRDIYSNGTLDCADWVPRPDMFPNGIQAVTSQIPLILYSWGFIPPSMGNQMTNWTWETSLQGNEACVALDEVYGFFSMIRDRFLTYGGISFEEDNLGSFSSDWTSHTLTVDATSTWWQGFASPFCEANIPVQICESLISDLLESLKYPCVTTTRDNIDDVPGNHQDPNDPNAPYFLNRWKVGFDRMFIGALGLKPFFDNVWTMPSQPSPSPWGNLEEYYVELAYALSVFTAGTVGIGDMPNNENRTLIMTGCMDDGTLLLPSLPSSYIDAVYLPNSIAPFDVTIGRVFQAISYIPESFSEAELYRSSLRPNTVMATNGPAYATILGIDISKPFSLYPSYITPDLSIPITNNVVQGYLYLPWTPGFVQIDSQCQDGDPAYWCLSVMDNTNPIVINTGVAEFNYTHNWELYTLAPWYSNGYGLMGELTKFIRISPIRFPWVNASTTENGEPSLTFGVVGAANENVTVLIVVPPPTESSSTTTYEKSTLRYTESTETPLKNNATGVLRRLQISFPPNTNTSSIVVTCIGVGSTPCSW